MVSALKAALPGMIRNSRKSYLISYIRVRIPSIMINTIDLRK